MTSTQSSAHDHIADQVLPDSPRVPDDLSALPGLTVSADAGRLACRLRLAGALDADGVPLFAACLEGWVDRGVRHLVIDLTDVRTVDEAGARSLTAAAHVLGRAAGSMSLLAPRHLVDGPLGRCGLELVEQPASSDHDTVIGISHVER